MSILATKPDLDKIITKAVKRIGENHALARDGKGVEMKALEVEEDRKNFRKGRTEEVGNETMNSVIEESLKAVANEMAEKMVLENTIDGMIKDVINEDTVVNNLKMKKPWNTLSSTEMREAKDAGYTKDSWTKEISEATKVNETTTETIKKLVTKKLKDKLSEAKHPGYDAYEKAVKKSNALPKWYLNANTTINTLNAKQDRTQFDAVRLANQMYKIENRSLSKIYKELANPSAEIQSLISEILGKSQFPTFAQFKAKAKKGQIYFSVYSGLLIVKQFNKIARTRSKVARQNKATANK